MDSRGPKGSHSRIRLELVLLRTVTPLEVLVSPVARKSGQERQSLFGEANCAGSIVLVRVQSAVVSGSQSYGASLITQVGDSGQDEIDAGQELFSVIVFGELPGDAAHEGILVGVELRPFVGHGG